jgi:radical SAM-linked protein
MRCLERLFRRAGLALGMSQGFHPKPRLTFPLALAVGIEGEDEVLEVELTETPQAEELLDRLSRQTPPGLAFRSVEVLPAGSPKARPRSASYQAPIPPSRRAGLEERIGRLWAADSWPWHRPRGHAVIDLRADLLSLTLSEDVLQMRLRAGPEGRAGPRDVLAALDLADIEHEGVRLARTAVEIDP